MTSTFYSEKTENESVLSEIRLPSAAYALLFWKVQSGAAVRRGETIALLRHKDNAVERASRASSTEESAALVSALASASAVPKYKRPTKRRRPVAASTSTTSSASSSSTTSSVALRPGFLQASLSNRVSATTRPTSDSPTAESSNDSSSLTTASFREQQQSPPLSEGTLPLLAPADGLIRLGKPKGSDSSEINTKSVSADLVIGFIVACDHPTVVGGLCAVCGQTAGATVPTTLPQALRQQQQQQTISLNDFDTWNANDNTNYTSNNGTDDNNQLTRVTVSGGITMTISKTEGQRMAQQDAQRLRQQRKLSLVLDLDHTLLHATNDIRARRHLHRSDVRTLILPVAWEGQPGPTSLQPPTTTLLMQHFVKLRPHLRQFLQTASVLYEVGVYTAGTRQYAEQITQLLARHMADSRYDQIDIDGLRQRFQQCQQRLYTIQQKIEALEREQQLSEPNDDESPKAPPSDQSSKESKDNASIKKYVTNEAKIKEPSTRTTGKRKVRFGDTADKTDALPFEQEQEQLQKQLAQYKEELVEAEAGEQRANEYRQRLFGTRIVSRTDVADLGINVKSLKRIFPCGGTMAVVVDDREDVWANAADNETAGEPPDNMLLVRPYHWKPFAGFADVNNSSGDDFGADQEESENKKGTEEEEEEEDRQLLWTADVLRQIHEAYYETMEDKPQPGRRTVPEIVRDMRRQILKGSHLVLSGVVPLHRQQASPGRPREPHVRHAENLGAIVSPDVTPTVTHVVAGRNGTDKIVAARRVPGCHIVKPLWLMECVWTFSCRNVKPYLWPVLKTAPRTAVKRSPSKPLVHKTIDQSASETTADAGTTSTAEESSAVPLNDDDNNDDDDDDDDDDLVAELESDLMQG